MVPCPLKGPRITNIVTESFRTWNLKLWFHLTPYVRKVLPVRLYTRKNAQLVTNCSRLVASLLQQLVDRMCSHWLSSSLLTRLLQACRLQQTCYKLDELNSLVTSLFQQLVIGLQSTACQQVVSRKLGTT